MNLHKIHSHFESNSLGNGGGNDAPTKLIGGGDGEEPPNYTLKNIQVQEYQFMNTVEFDIAVVLGIIFFIFIYVLHQNK